MIEIEWGDRRILVNERLISSAEMIRRDLDDVEVGTIRVSFDRWFLEFRSKDGDVEQLFGLVRTAMSSGHNVYRHKPEKGKP